MKREVSVGGVTLAIDPLFLLGESFSEDVPHWNVRMIVWLKSVLSKEREY